MKIFMNQDTKISLLSFKQYKFIKKMAFAIRLIYTI